MSAAGNVEQKSKPQRSQAQNGPVNNPKEVSSENSFERYMPSNQVTQGYTAAPTNMAPAADTYMASYYPSTYSFPYSMPGSENTWSTGGDNFNSNYSYDFSYQTQDYYNQPGTTPPYLGQSFNFFPGNADYTQGSWNGQGQAGAPTAPSSYYDYSRYPGAQASANVPRSYQGVNGYEMQDGKAHGMKAVEQGMSVLHLSQPGGDKGPGGVPGSNGKVDPRTGQAPGTANFPQAGGGAPSGGGKQTSWAAIASKPAKPLPKTKLKSSSHAPVPTQLPSMKQPMAIGTWNTGDKPVGKVEGQTQPPPVTQPPNGSYAPQAVPPQNTPPVQAVPPQPVVKPEELPTPQQASQIPQGKQGFGSSEQSSGRSQPQAVVQPQPQNRWASSSQSHHGRSSNSGSGGYSTRSNNARNSANSGSYSSSAGVGSSTSVVLEKLRSSNEYNPSDLTLELQNARFFIIKSYSEDDIHRSIKYGIWCSTEHGNKKLDSAFKDKKGDKASGTIYLLFSVNGSGHFCGIAEMTSAVDYNTNTGVWAQDKWKGRFDVKWIYVKDVPNNQLRHIRLENNENKPVTNSRDTQEVPLDKAKQVVKIIHGYRHMTSIFDDFSHYEKRQEEDSQRKTRPSRGGHRN